MYKKLTGKIIVMKKIYVIILNCIVFFHLLQGVAVFNKQYNAEMANQKEYYTIVDFYTAIANNNVDLVKKILSLHPSYINEVVQWKSAKQILRAELQNSWIQQKIYPTYDYNNVSKNSPLQHAIATHSVPLIEFLVKNKADIYYKNKNNHNSLDLVREYNRKMLLIFFPYVDIFEPIHVNQIKKITWSNTSWLHVVLQYMGPDMGNMEKLDTVIEKSKVWRDNNKGFPFANTKDNEGKTIFDHIKTFSAPEQQKNLCEKIFSNHLVRLPFFDPFNSTPEIKDTLKSLRKIEFGGFRFQSSRVLNWCKDNPTKTVVGVAAIIILLKYRSTIKNIYSESKKR